MEIRKTALVARPSTAVFDLIEAAEHYPGFMPWCTAATILSRDDSVVVARIAVDYRGARFEFTTRNPKRRPEWMAIRLEEGPFQRFEGEWRLAPLGAEGSRIDFELRYAFASALLGRLAAPVFDGIANEMVDAFVRRAEEMTCVNPPPPGRGELDA